MKKIVLSILLLFIYSDVYAESQESKILFDEAVKLSQDKTKINEAVSKFELLISKNKNIPSAYNNLGVLYIKRKEYDKAVDMLKTAIDLNQGYNIARENLGDLYVSLAKEQYSVLVNNEDNLKYKDKLSYTNNILTYNKDVSEDLPVVSAKPKLAEITPISPVVPEIKKSKIVEPEVKETIVKVIPKEQETIVKNTPKEQEFKHPIIMDEYSSNYSVSSDSLTATEKNNVSTMINKWEVAMEDKDWQNLFSLYSTDFKSSENTAYELWKKRRSLQIDFEPPRRFVVNQISGISENGNYKITFSVKVNFIKDKDKPKNRQDKFTWVLNKDFKIIKENIN